MDIYNSDADIRRVVNQLVDGTYSQGDKEMYRDLYNSLLTAQGGSKADTYFILKNKKERLLIFYMGGRFLYEICMFEI